MIFGLDFSKNYLQTNFINFFLVKADPFELRT